LVVQPAYLMKKIFQNLRENWITYGFETLVVIVGILIAYTLNNWNQEGKDKAREIQLLSELHKEMESTEARWTRSLEISKKEIASKQAVIDVISAELPWHDSLQQHFNRFHFYQAYVISKTSYNSLESWGFNNLSNDSIRTQITQLFQQSDQYIEKLNEVEYDLMIGDLIGAFSSQLDFGNPSAVKPVEHEDFIKRKDLGLRLRYVKMATLFSNKQRIVVLKEISNLKNNLKAEINRLEK